MKDDRQFVGNEDDLDEEEDEQEEQDKSQVGILILLDQRLSSLFFCKEPHSLSSPRRASPFFNL